MVDAADRLVGRVTVDAVVDFIRERVRSETLSRGGLREDEDIFASVLEERPKPLDLAGDQPGHGVHRLARDRRCSRAAIEKLVALAALMPIVAGIGGNSGNQTITMIVRALALGPDSRPNAKTLLAKEIAIALLNGLVWGGIVGVFALLLYTTGRWAWS